LDDHVVIVRFDHVLDLRDLVPDSDGEANGRGSDALVLSDTEAKRFPAVEICALAEEFNISGAPNSGPGALVHLTPECLVSCRLDRLESTIGVASHRNLLESRMTTVLRRRSASDELAGFRLSSKGGGRERRTAATV
jgi:hypothetical protein